MEDEAPERLCARINERNIKSMKTLAELAKSIYNARNLPHVLAELHITAATMYSEMNDQWVEIQLKKADFWQVKDYREEAIPTTQARSVEDLEKTVKYQREKPLSDKAVEMMWLQTPEGKKEMRIKYCLKSLEKLMSAVKSSLVNASIEARNI